MKKVKALVLLSGGLDSMLAAKILQVQDIEVAGICFTSNFFSSDKARIAAEQLGLNLLTVDIGEKILALVKNPPSGHGKNLNPCIDCHALMLKEAIMIVKKDGFDFVATGEVLGQRPFSQNKDALARVQALAGQEILRPLSAKLLPETAMEKNGLVSRAGLLDISGRSRERQTQLAKKYAIKEYPSPAGGCLLTDPSFSARLQAMLDNWSDCVVADVEILKNGRCFWLIFNKNNGKKPILVIIGRNEAENNRLIKLAKRGDFMLELEEITGPVALLRSRGFELQIKPKILEIKVPKCLKLEVLINKEINNFDELINQVSLLVGYHSPKARGEKARVRLFLTTN